MQILTGIIAGVLGVLLIAGFSFLLVQLWGLNQNLKKSSEVFGNMADLSATMKEQLAAIRRMISVTEQMNASFKVFNSLVLRDSPPSTEPGEFPPIGEFPRSGRSSPGRTPPPPPVAEWEEYADQNDADVFAQSDEQMADVETKQQARESGVDTESPLPSPDQVHMIQS